MSNEIEITQNGAGVSEIAQPKSESGGLWCIYLAGPDDLVAMPSKAVAEAVARNFNAVWERYGAERGHDVHAVAHAEPWMHGKEAHGKDIREHFHEYADLVLDEDAGRFKPAQPVEAVDGDRLAAAARAMHAVCDGEDRWLRMSDEVRAQWINSVHPVAAALAHPRPTGAVALISVVANGDPVLQPVEGWDRLSLGNHLLYAAPTVEQVGKVVQVEARRCDVCDHIGVNDASSTQGACHNCEWQGDEQEDDLCPSCGSHSCMAAACPECGGRYCLVASAEVIAQPRPSTTEDSSAVAQPRPVGVPDAVVKLAAIECARRAYGYWKGDSTGGDSAMRYFDGNRGLAGISHTIDMMESAIRKHIAAAPDPEVQ